MLMINCHGNNLGDLTNDINSISIPIQNDSSMFSTIFTKKNSRTKRQVIIKLFQMRQGKILLPLSFKVGILPRGGSIFCMSQIFKFECIHYYNTKIINSYNCLWLYITRATKIEILWRLNLFDFDVFAQYLRK